MANADKTLLNKDNLEIYPITRERNVYDENNVNLKEKFKTVVFKDNEVHQFAEELCEESANIFKIPDIPETTKNGITYSIKDGVVSVSGTCTANTTIFDIYNIETENRGSIKLFNNLSTSGYPYIEFNSWENYWDNGVFLNDIDRFKGKIYTTSRNHAALEIKTGFSATNVKLMPMITNIPVIPTTFGKYNPNRHITNSEAEFLKEKFDSAVNLLDIKSSDIQSANQGVTMTLNNDGGIHCVGTVSSNYFNIVKAISCYFPKGDYAFSVNKKLTQYSLFILLTYSDGTTGQMAIWKNSSSNIITFTKDVIKYAIFAGEATSGSVIDDILYIQLQKGNVVTPHNKYNSSSHITNSQADLLKSEYEKSKNKLKVYGDVSKNVNGVDITLYSNSKLKLNGTATEDGWYEFITNGLGATGTVSQKKYSLDTNKSYTFSFNSNVELPTSVNIFLQLNSSGNVGVNRDKKFVTGNNFDGVYRGWIYIPKGTVCNNLTINLQLEEGEVATSWSAWNGSIIHEKDIEPVLLWKNGNPTTELSPNENVNMLSRKEYKKLIVKYKIHSSTQYVEREIKIDNRNSTNDLLIIKDSDAVDYNCVRRIIFKSDTTFQIRECLKGSSTDNWYLIITEILGSNY